MRRLFVLLVLSPPTVAIICMALVLLADHAMSRGAYPSITQLEGTLDVYPGRPLPNRIIANGRMFTPYIESARDLGRGRYAVIVELR